MPGDRITLIEPYGNLTSNRSVPHGMTGEDAYERLRIHHPNSNANAERTQDPADMERNGRGVPRAGQVVEGAMEEVSFVGDRNGIPLVKKDLIMETDRGSRNMMIPNPVAGYVQFTGDSANTINVWSGPPTDANRELVGRVLHGAAGSSSYTDGQYVPYGAPLVRQSNVGTPPVHAHVELEPDQFRRYLGDILNDRITRERWPEQTPGQTRSTEGAPAPVAGASITDRDHPGNPLFQRVAALTEQARPPLTDEQRAYIAMTATTQGMTAESLATVATRANANGGLEVAFGTNVQGQRSEGWTQLPQTLPPVERTSDYVREELQSRTQPLNPPPAQDAPRMSGP